MRRAPHRGVQGGEAPMARPPQAEREAYGQGVALFPVYRTGSEYTESPRREQPTEGICGYVRPHILAAGAAAQ